MVFAHLRYFWESELPAVEHQHALFAGRTLRLYAKFVQQGANLVQLVFAEIGHGTSLGLAHSRGIGADGLRGAHPDGGKGC